MTCFLGIERDRQRDEVLKSQAEKDAEHDKKFEELRRQNEELQRLIEANADKVSSLTDEVENLRNGKENYCISLCYCNCFASACWYSVFYIDRIRIILEK